MWVERPCVLSIASVISIISSAIGLYVGILHDTYYLITLLVGNTVALGLAHFCGYVEVEEKKISDLAEVLSTIEKHPPAANNELDAPTKIQPEPLQGILRNNSGSGRNSRYIKNKQRRNSQQSVVSFKDEVEQSPLESLQTEPTSDLPGIPVIRRRSLTIETCSVVTYPAGRDPLWRHSMPYMSNNDESIGSAPQSKKRHLKVDSASGSTTPTSLRSPVATRMRAKSAQFMSSQAQGMSESITGNIVYFKKKRRRKSSFYPPPVPNLSSALTSVPLPTHLKLATDMYQSPSPKAERQEPPSLKVERQDSKASESVSGEEEDEEEDDEPRSIVVPVPPNENETDVVSRL